MATDATLILVRQVASGLYLSVSSLGFLLFVLGLLFFHLRVGSKLALILTTTCQAAFRSYLFLVEPQYFTDVVKQYGLTMMLILDIVPEALFLLIYIQLLSTWIEISRSLYRLRRFRFVVVLILDAAMTLLLILSCVVLVVYVYQHFPNSEQHSWKHYEEVSNWEGNFITSWSGGVFGVFVCVGSFLIAMIARASLPSVQNRRMRIQMLFLAVLCTLSFFFRAIYVHVLNSIIRKKRQRNEISESTFDWIFFSYFAVLEILPEFLLLGVLGVSTVAFLWRGLCRRRERSASHLKAIPLGNIASSPSVSPASGGRVFGGETRVHVVEGGENEVTFDMEQTNRE